MICKLCQSKEAIKNSHIIPKFISNWIKETSRLGGLRNAANPNRREQDTFKTPLLCLDCEELLSKVENDFSREIFLPFNDDGKSEFSYSDWLLYFTTSLVWRVGTSRIDKFRIEHPTMSFHLEEALQNWGDSLMGKSGISKNYAHHLFFDSVYHCRIRVGLCYDERYALRTIDYGIPFDGTAAAIYVKIPGMVFFTGILPAEPDGWENTRISSSGKISTKDQQVNDTFFWQYMENTVVHLAESMDGMSETQKKDLEERLQSAKPEWQIRKERS